MCDLIVQNQYLICQDTDQITNQLLMMFTCSLTSNQKPLDIQKIISQSSSATTLIFQDSPRACCIGFSKEITGMTFRQNIPMSPEIFLNNKNAARHHKSHYFGRIPCSEKYRNLALLKWLLPLHNVIWIVSRYQ